MASTPALRTCVSEAKRDPATHPVARERLEAMLAFTETMNGWFTQMLTVPRSKLTTLVRLGTKTINFLPAAKKR